MNLGFQMDFTLSKVGRNINYEIESSHFQYYSEFK